MKINGNTIKAKFRNKFGKDLRINSVVVHEFGTIVIKCTRFMKGRAKDGVLLGFGDINEKGEVVVELEKKIEWI
tara:strand:+ start:265 stop:486 length:222 start_codon:yes stop_codon:yes gene_type:complete